MKLSPKVGRKMSSDLLPFFTLLFFLLTPSCKPVSPSSTDPESESGTVAETIPVENTDDLIPPIPPVVSSIYSEQITELVKNSSCATYSWKNRGRAPLGYIKGVALSYARSLCRYKASLKTPSPLAAILTAPRGDAARDAIAHYLTSFENLAIKTNSSGTEPLRALYILGIGLGMRESSGKYCTGWDTSAGANRSSSAAEAGIFQTSYDSMTTPELKALYAEYLAKPEQCLLEVFKEGATCGTQSILGTGAGANYQKFNKSCPAFATEYAMVMLRIRRKHYGPINRKEAEVNPRCDVFLKKVESFVNDNPYSCDDLI